MFVSSAVFAYTQLSIDRSELQANAEDGAHNLELFLKISNNIVGESKDAKHMNEVDLESYHWSESKGGMSTATRGSTSVRVDMKDFIFVMRYNKASPLLFKACASGQILANMNLTVRKVGSISRDFLIWYFTDVVVTSYETAGEYPMEFPLDRITISFSTIRVRYLEYNWETGALKGETLAGWNLISNQPIY